MTLCSSLPLPFVHIFSETKSTFQRCSGITRDWWLISQQNASHLLSLTCHPCAHICFFWNNFSKFFRKQCRKGKKHRSCHLKLFWEQGVSEISEKKKEKRKLASLGKNLNNFLEKYIWMKFFCSQVTGNFTNKRTVTRVYIKNFAYIFRIPFSSSQWLLQKVCKRREFVLENQLVSHPRINSSIGAERSSILAKF